MRSPTLASLEADLLADVCMKPIWTHDAQEDSMAACPLGAHTTSAWRKSKNHLEAEIISLAW